MKTLFFFLQLFFLTTAFGQNGLTGGTIGPKPTNDSRTILEIIRGRADNPRLNANDSNGFSGGNVGPRPVNDSLLNNSGGGVGGIGGGPKPGNYTRTANANPNGVIGSMYNHDQAVSVLTNASDLINRKYDKEEVLPTRLHIESINLSSDEVTEITLKDGSVVKVEDLQEFVRQKMKEKLNQ